MKITEKKLNKIVIMFQRLAGDCLHDVYHSDFGKDSVDMRAIAGILEMHMFESVEETVRQYYARRTSVTA